MKSNPCFGFDFAKSMDNHDETTDTTPQLPPQPDAKRRPSRRRVKIKHEQRSCEKISILLLLAYTVTSFYVTHLAQPNESSRRRVVAVIKTSSEAATA